ncbi:tellurite resistance TerB family protein [Salinisphaera aquimarina]|uniref:TerB family tellurite resistance protein n=1 Tax=Salinisphaera aquimarina TaxID=2094031 RepID=A0ABV7ETJ7_9GAMM
MGLLERFKHALNPETEAQRDPEQAKRIAAAVLLLEMAHADNRHDDEEYEEIRRQLKTHFRLDDAETEELINAATPRAEQAVSLYKFLKTLNDGLSPEEKRQVLEMLWRVAYADRHLDAHEEHLLREIAELLYLPHSEFIRAKLAVTGE